MLLISHKKSLTDWILQSPARHLLALQVSLVFSKSHPSSNKPLGHICFLRFNTLVCIHIHVGQSVRGFPH